MESEFSTLLARVRRGDDSAASYLFNEYAPLVRRVVRRQLNGRFRRRIDSEDFVQSVWRSVFVTAIHRCTFDTPEQFVGYIVNMTRNKVVTTVRRHTAKRADIDVEVALDSEYEPADENAIDALGGSILDEQWAQFDAALSAQERDVLSLKADGLTFEAIGERLGMSERTVRRILRRVIEKAALDAE